MKRLIRHGGIILLMITLLNSSVYAHLPFNDSNNASDSSAISCTIGESRITMRNARTSLRIDNSLHFEILFTDKCQTYSINDANESFIARLYSNDSATSFRRKAASTTDISDKTGKGKKLTIEGVSSDDRISCLLSFVSYYNFPDAIVVQCSFKNISGDLFLLKSYSINHLSIQHPLKEKKWWTFEGASYYWGQDFAFELPKSFSRENYMGLNDTRVGSGIPLIDVWNRRFGLALAYIGQKPRLIYLPVKAENGKVKMEMKEKSQAGSLAPNETLTTPLTVIIPHSGDFFQPLQTYSGLMRPFLPPFKKPSDFAYQPEWCTWGYREEFNPQEVINSLDRLKSLKIKSVILDDGWSKNHGDWIPDPSKFPNGDKDFKKLVNEIHNKDLKAWIWWLPGYVDSTSELAAHHPDWLVKNKDGSVNPSYALCPAYAPVQQFYKKLVKKFVSEYKLDGLKLDFQEINSAPPCYNPEHHHSDPLESYYSTPTLFKNIYETAKRFNPNMLIEYCSCGIPPSVFHLPWINLAVTSDPAIQQTTQRIKMYKALMGNDFPVLEEYCGVLAGPLYQLTIGAGGVPGTFSTYLDDSYHQKWLNIYQKNELSKGQYLNLYDIAFDYPEAHVIKKDHKFFYAFYTHPWKQTEPDLKYPAPITQVFRYGTEFDNNLKEKTEFKYEVENYSGVVELRGLEKNKEYKVIDYANNRYLSKIKGDHPFLEVSFNDYLLLEVTPIIEQ